MSLKVKKANTKKIPPVAQGVYPAICVAVIDLGEQRNDFQGRYEDKVKFTWEIPSQTVEVDGEQKPRWVSKDFRASLHENSNLSKIIEAWRSAPITDEERENGIDLSWFLGRSCQIWVTVKTSKNGNDYNDIKGVMSLPAGMEQLTTESELLLFDIDELSEKRLAELPEWVQRDIKQSTQYQKLNVPAEEVDIPESDQVIGVLNDKEEEVPF